MDLLKRFRERKKILFSTIFIVCMASLVTLVGLGMAYVYQKIDVSSYELIHPSPVILDRHGRLLFPFLNEKQQWQFPIPLEKIHPKVIQATLATEDKRFYRHYGVDPVALTRAVIQAIRHQRIVSGASTLSMQVAKHLRSSENRYLDKLWQILDALQLERNASKEAILELYLNCAPYGGNLVGIEAASRRYFGKRANELVLHEAALLAGLPKAPTRFNPIHYPERARQRRNFVLRRMYEESLITEHEYQEAIHAPLGVCWNAFAQLAWHTAQSLRTRAVAERTLHTTLDADLQKRLEDQVKQHLRQFKHEINNAALMVIDVPMREVLARVGSADFWDSTLSGQYDICRAPRAPGSTLKPFIYALAMEKQCLYPSEVFLDKCLDYGVYNPYNFDGTFSGLVSATDALRWSLNVPAVQILDRVGLDAAVMFLYELGFETVHNRPSDYYGLGLVLGNCEVRLESLANAYLALAHLGIRQDAILVKGATRAKPKRVVSEGVACAIWYMLQQPFPNEPWSNLVRANGRPNEVCWKTGTSTGYRDAWAVVFNAHYLVIVWLGNTDGRSSSYLIGAQAALPLAARIFRSLPKKTGPTGPAQEGRMIEVPVCAATGLPKSPWCPATVFVWFPCEQLLHRRCTVHRPSDDGNPISVWPPTSRGWDLAKVPDASSSSEGYATARKNLSGEEQRQLAIVAPANNATYVASGRKEKDRLRLQANQDTDPLYWYYDGKFIGQSDRMNRQYLVLEPGEHTVACMTLDGKTDKVVFVVQ